MDRISFKQYGMMLAYTAAKRSEDPFRQVGCVAFDKDNRVIGMGYNGLPSGFITPSGFWDDRDARQKYMIHAEINLCSLFVRSEAKDVFVTTMPCTNCFKTLIAHDIKNIYYGEGYLSSDAEELAKLFNINLQQITP